MKIKGDIQKDQAKDIQQQREVWLLHGSGTWRATEETQRGER